MREDRIIMSTKELKRLNLVHKLKDRRITQKQSAELLEISERQVRRLLRRYEADGERGLVHGNRGRPSNRKYTKQVKKQVLCLCKKYFEGFGPTLACEKLQQRHKLKINRETLRQWFLENGLWQRQRKHRGSFQWRERKACFGEMIQIDGSHHAWLEDRGPKLVLMAYVDDATNEVYARFYDHEGTRPILESFYQYFRRYGLPSSVYLDRHSAYKRKDDKGRNSQFARALDELGVKLIHAHSPEAKGRVERLFKTLQDRLVKELRLEDVKDQETANKVLKQFLVRHNQKFRRVPRSDRNLHQDISLGLEIKQVLAIRQNRCLRRDNTVCYENQTYLITSPWEYEVPKNIEVQERVDGKIYLVSGGITLRYRKITPASLEHLKVA